MGSILVGISVDEQVVVRRRCPEHVHYLTLAVLAALAALSEEYSLVNWKMAKMAIRGWPAIFIGVGVRRRQHPRPGSTGLHRFDLESALCTPKGSWPHSGVPSCLLAVTSCDWTLTEDVSQDVASFIHSTSLCVISVGRQ